MLTNKQNRKFSDFLAEFDSYDENPREDLERVLSESGLLSTMQRTERLESIED